jgi:hypothetical protein
MLRRTDPRGAECKILRVLRLVPIAWLAGCGAPEAPGRNAAPDSAVAEAKPPDSLVLVVGEATVWHTLSREATGSGGERCLERTLEIRREGAAVVRVPLL